MGVFYNVYPGTNLGVFYNAKRENKIMEAFHPNRSSREVRKLKNPGYIIRGMGVLKPGTEVCDPGYEGMGIKAGVRGYGY